MGCPEVFIPPRSCKRLPAAHQEPFTLVRSTWLLGQADRYGMPGEAYPTKAPSGICVVLGAAIAAQGSGVAFPARCDGLTGLE
jgi:hypothetical protein